MIRLILAGSHLLQVVGDWGSARELELDMIYGKKKVEG